MIIIIANLMIGDFESHLARMKRTITQSKSICVM